jgi:hypothetical protein
MTTPTAEKSLGVEKIPLPAASQHRLWVAFSTEGPLPEQATPTVAPSGVLDFDYLERFIEAASAQLPQALCAHAYPAEALRGVKEFPVSVEHVYAAIFTMPLGGIVAALVIDFVGTLSESIDLMSQVHRVDRFTLNGKHWDDCVNKLLDNADWRSLQGRTTPSDGYSILFIAEKNEELFAKRGGQLRDADLELVRRVLYRDRRRNLPFDPEKSVVLFPPETSRHPGELVAVGQLTTVAAGHESYISNVFALSAVRIVSATALCRQIRDAAYAALLLAQQHAKGPRGNLRQRRDQLENLAAKLEKFELQLSFGVEAYSDISLLLPSGRATNFHRALYCAVGLPQAVETTSEMLTRLERAIAADAQALRLRARAADDRRRDRLSIAIGVVSIVAVASAFVFGFFGAHTTQVGRDPSLFDIERFGWMYVIAGGLSVLPVLVYLALWALERSRSEDREST